MWENEKYDIANGLLTMCSSSYSMQDVDDSTFYKEIYQQKMLALFQMSDFTG